MPTHIRKEKNGIIISGSSYVIPGYNAGVFS